MVIPFAPGASNDITARLIAPRLSESLGNSVVVDNALRPARPYDAAALHARECRVLMDAVFDDFDVLLAPSAIGEAPRGLSSTGSAVFNRMWTLLGVPCVTLPCTRGPTGLPVGVQIIGRYRADRKTLDAAAWIERQVAVKA